MTTHVTNIPVEEQLVPVFTAKIGNVEVAACDARALHAYLQNGDLFANWIKARIEKYEFQENLDFALALENTKASHGAHNRKDYHLTLDMAKELAMVENNAKGREVRRYFIKIEKLALTAITQQPNSANLIATARAWADMAQIQANMAKAQADTAQAQADKARAWADEYERRVATAAQSPASSQPPNHQLLLPPREAAFIQAWWDCLGTQSVTASDLYRAVTAKQCQILNDASGALLGDVAQWTPKKLVVPYTDLTHFTFLKKLL